MKSEIKKALMSSSVDEVGDLLDTRTSGDVRITTNELEIKEQSREIRKLSRVLSRCTPEFRRDFKYVRSKNFDIKKLKKYDTLRSTYEYCKGYTDEYSRFYCEAFEFLDSSKCSKIVEQINTNNISKEDFEEFSEEGVLGILIGTVKSLATLGPILAILFGLMIFLLIVCIVLISITLYTNRKRAGDQNEVKSAIEENPAMVKGLIKPSKVVLKWINSVSDNPKALFSNIKKNEMKLKKESDEFLFTALVVVAGIGLAILFLRWAISFVINVRMSIVSEFEDADEILRYRLDEIEREISDPRTDERRRKTLMKIKENLIKQIEKLNKTKEKFEFKSKKAISESVDDDEEDDKVVEAESEQNDDDPSNGPDPIFL